jgi:hypothetical protein
MNVHHLPQVDAAEVSATPVNETQQQISVEHNKEESQKSELTFFK